MDYPRVERGHFLPRVYQRPWAVRDIVELHVVGKTGSRPVSTRDVGVVRRAYRRERPDGSQIDDIEWSLRHIENAIGPILNSVEKRWPLLTKDKAALAEFFGLQMVRGPRWWAEREKRVRETLANFKIEGVEGDDGSRRELSDEEASEAERHFLGSTDRNVDMIDLSRKLAAVLGSMHWTLLRFEQPVIALSDHPIVVWPIGRNTALPSVAVSMGVLQALEVRAPISPHLAVLMTWIVDRDPSPLDGGLRDARAINAFTVAQAYHQWVHKIGAKPLIGTGKMRPVSRSLYRGYDADAVRRSSLRTAAERNWREDTGGRLARELTVVSVSRR